MKVLIVGGGLAGLSAGTALARDGHDVTIIEMTGQVDGSLISITNRAVDALEELGVLEELRPHSYVVEGAGSLLARVHDGAGNPLPVPEPPSRTDTRLPASVSLLRPILARALANAAREAGADLRVGISVTAILDGDDMVTATLTDGTIGSYDLIVGADGIHSQVRAMCFPDLPSPAYTGCMSFRWVLPDGPEGPLGLYALPDNEMFIVLRLPSNEVYLSTGVDMERRHVAPDEARSMLRVILERFTAPMATALLDRLDEDQAILMRPYDWINVQAPWHRGRVVLIGDAVHATTAHLASGGSLALEDGIVLAQELARSSSLDACLDAFCGRRAPRASMVVEISVELLNHQRQRAAPAISAAVRSSAVAALQAPY